MSLSWQREPFEPERYELAEAPRFHLDVGRRGFLQALGGGIAVLVAMPADVAAAEREGAGGDGAAQGQGREQNIAAWLGLAATDPLTYGLVAAVLLGSAFAACLPALRHAIGTRPTLALRAS